jgi:hypothetical protein
MVINELTHVERWQFAQNMMSNAAKMPWGLVIIATNSGTKGTKAETWRNNAVKSKEWFSLVWDKPAPWIDLQDVEDERARCLSMGEFNRLWWGKWSSGKGDALNEADIDRCLSKHEGPVEKPQPGWIYVAGLDLGISHDHSGMVVLGVNPREQRIRLARMKGWKPSMDVGDGKKEVDLTSVENECLSVSRRFNVCWFGYDPAAGGSYMAQRLRAKQVAMMEMSFSSPTNLSLMATSLVQSIKEGRLEGYDEDGVLRRDLGKFSIVAKVKDKEWGYKLDAVSDETGHADIGTALVICLHRAVALMYGIGLSSDDDLIDGSEEETEEDMKNMPDELRELYE